MKKYKLIKSYPGSEPVGRIVTNHGDGCYTGGIPRKHVESNPEFFARYLFTTEDKVEIYQGEIFTMVVDNQWHYSDHINHTGNVKYFSTREAAEAYLSLKPKFQKGEWLYYDSGLSKTLFRFCTITSDDYYTNEGYQIMNSGSVYCFDDNARMWNTYDNATKASPEKIEEILVAVAKHKGFKEGVKFKSAWSSDLQTVLSETFTLYNENLYVDSEQEAFVYYKGKWAEIVKEEMPGYVECISEQAHSMKLGKIYKAFYNPDSDHPYRWYSDTAINSDDGYNNKRRFFEVFKPSTKEAYDAQNSLKELTITLDGDVIKTSHYGNNVKITYK